MTLNSTRSQYPFTLSRRRPWHARFNGIYRTSMSMQLFRKQQLEIGTLASIQEVHYNRCRSEITNQFVIFVTDVFHSYVQPTLPQEVVWKKPPSSVLLFEKWDTPTFCGFFHVFNPKIVKLKGSFWCRFKTRTHFPNCCQLKSYRYLRPFSLKSTKHGEKARFLREVSLWCRDAVTTFQSKNLFTKKTQK